jgi:hypothetical protein
LRLTHLLLTLTGVSAKCLRKGAGCQFHSGGNKQRVQACTGAPFERT